LTAVDHFRRLSQRQLLGLIGIRMHVGMKVKRVAGNVVVLP
jgi:hypothetical protein